MRKRKLSKDRFASSYEHGEVRILRSSTAYPQVEPLNAKGLLAAKYRSRPPHSEKLVLEEFRRLDQERYPVWFQHVLHGFIVDFYFPLQRLVVEVNGPHHRTPARIQYDRFRAHILRSNGHKIHNIPAFLVYDQESRGKQVHQVAERLAKIEEEEKIQRCR